MDQPNPQTDPLDLFLRKGATTHFKTLDPYFLWKRGDVTTFAGGVFPGRMAFLLQLMLTKSLAEAGGCKWLVYSDAYDLKMRATLMFCTAHPEVMAGVTTFIDDSFTFLPLSKMAGFEDATDVDGIVVDRPEFTSDEHVAEFYRAAGRQATLYENYFIVIPSRERTVLYSGQTIINRTDNLISQHPYYGGNNKNMFEIRVEKVKRIHSGGGVGKVSFVFVPTLQAVAEFPILKK